MGGPCGAWLLAPLTLVPVERCVNTCCVGRWPEKSYDVPLLLGSGQSHLPGSETMAHGTEGRPVGGWSLLVLAIRIPSWPPSETEDWASALLLTQDLGSVHELRRKQGPRRAAAQWGPLWMLVGSQLAVLVLGPLSPGLAKGVLLSL